MARKSRKNVGLIGLGIIGSRVAAALRGAGFATFVWNRTPRPEPNFLSSPAEIADVCDVIQIFVADAPALIEVIDAFGDLIGPRHTILCCATIGPEATIEAAKLVEQRGAKFLDAPFTGSKIAAEKRELVYYIGGDDEVLRKVEPVLQASSKAIVKIGGIGDAATVKIATNMMAAIVTQSLIEALAVVKNSGINPEALTAALEHHGVRCGLTDMKLPRVIERDYEPHFSLKHMFKDAQIAIHIANSLGIDIPATTACAGVMYGGLSRGWGDFDFSSTAKVYEPEETESASPEAQSEPKEPIATESSLAADSTTVEQHENVAGKNGDSGKTGAPSNEDQTDAAQPEQKNQTEEKAGAKQKENLQREEPGGAQREKETINIEAVVVGATKGNNPARDGQSAEKKFEPTPKPGRMNRVKRWFVPRPQS